MKDQFLFCCISYQIKSLPGRHLYDAATGLGQRHVCHMMNNVLFPWWTLRVVTSGSVRRLLKLSRDDFSRTPETVCWMAGDPIHPYHPTTLDRAAADEWKLESPPLPAPTCGTITATVINHASPLQTPAWFFWFWDIFQLSKHLIELHNQFLWFVLKF